MWAQDQDKSCFTCQFVTQCNHVREIAFNVCYRIKDLRKGMFFFEHGAKTCKSYLPERKTKKKKIGNTIEFILGGLYELRKYYECNDCLLLDLCR